MLPLRVKPAPESDSPMLSRLVDQRLARPARQAPHAGADCGAQHDGAGNRPAVAAFMFHCSRTRDSPYCRARPRADQHRHDPAFVLLQVQTPDLFSTDFGCLPLTLQGTPSRSSGSHALACLRPCLEQRPNPTLRQKPAAANRAATGRRRFAAKARSRSDWNILASWIAIP